MSKKCSGKGIEMDIMGPNLSLSRSVSHRGGPSVAGLAPDWAPLTVEQQKHQQQLEPVSGVHIPAENAGELSHLEGTAAAIVAAALNSSNEGWTLPSHQAPGSDLAL